MKDFCKNHPFKEAVGNCAMCGKYFCELCLQKDGDNYYCKEHIQKFDLNKFSSSNNTSTTKKDKSSMKIIYIVTSIIIMGIAGVVGKECAKSIIKSSDKISVNSNKWETQRISYTGLSIEAPFILKESSFELPNDYKSMVKDIQSYRYVSNPISVNINYVVYTDDITPNLDGAAEGAINNMRVADGVSDFTYSVAETYKNNLPGRIIKGNFRIQKLFSRYVGFIFTKDTKTWQILFTYIDNEENDKIIDRMIRSLYIES